MTTLATLNSQLNTLLEKQASIARQAEAFAEDLERFETPLKELKKIADDWNVVPSNKTKKASYIAALQIAHAEKNGLTQVIGEIEDTQYQIALAEAQKQANTQREVVHVIRVNSGEWWVGTRETFKAISPEQGMEIHFTAHPEVPVQIEQEPPQELVAWLDEVREYAQNRESIISPTHKSYIITGYRTDGTSKKWRCIDAYQAEENARTLWETGRWVRLEINGEVRYPAQEETPSQGAASFFEEQQHGEGMLQSQEELQHAAALFAHVVLQQHPLSYCDILPKGNITITTQEGNVTLSAREAYALLETLYQARDVLYQEAQKNEEKVEREPQNSSLILYTIITDHLDTFTRMGYPIRYLLPDETSPALFHSSHSSVASQEFRTSYPNAKCVSLDEMDEECKKREKAYWEKQLLQGEEDTSFRLLGTEGLNWPKHERHHLGTGLLSWPPFERITGRYGTVALFREANTDEGEIGLQPLTWLLDIGPLEGKHGSLDAVIGEQQIELGTGTFFTETHYFDEKQDGITYIGLTPDEPHEEEWLDSDNLHTLDGYLTHNPVELWFVEQ